MNEKVRYRVWTKHDDCIAGSSGDSVNAGKKKLDFGNGRYRCKFFVGEREIFSVQGWNRIDVETAAADEAIRITDIRSKSAVVRCANKRSDSEEILCYGMRRQQHRQ